MGSIDWPWVIIAFLSFGAACLVVARAFYRAGYKDAMNEVDRYLDSVQARKKDVTFERVVVSHEPLEDDDEDECGNEETNWCERSDDCFQPKGHAGDCI